MVEDRGGMPRKSLRANILDAAERVIAKRGGATTLEAVAAEAGVSKGGLLYHFPGKRELLFALIERFEAKIAETEARVLPDLPDAPGKSLKAYILTRNDRECAKDIPPSRVVAFMDDPEFRDLLAENKRRAFAKVASDGLSPEFAAIITLATDGLWLQEMLGVDIIAPGFKKRIVAEMLRLIECEAKSKTVDRGREDGRSARAESAKVK